MANNLCGLGIFERVFFCDLEVVEEEEVEKKADKNVEILSPTRVVVGKFSLYSCPVI